ncbi:MAG: hypothetical protein Kow0062_15290 [Acidobacteriota bacterium]
MRERNGSFPTSLLLSGRIEAVPLAEVLQLVAGSGHDGVLCVEAEEPPARGEIEIVGGRIVRADVASRPQPLGAVLLRRGAVSEGALTRALERQSSAAPWRPLGELLLEMEAVDVGELAAGLAEQIETRAAEILGWSRGVFRYRTWGATRRTGLACEVGVALEPHELLLESARLADENAAH